MDKLSIRICNDDYPQSNGRFFYCFAHNDINIEVMAKGIKNILQDKDKVYIIKNNIKCSGVSKYNDVIDIYNSFGIYPLMIDYKHDWINTRIESEEVINWTQKNEIKKLIICAPPFHLVRAFMTAASVIIENKYDISLYAIPGYVNNWRDITISHQGLNKNSFNSFIDIELERIKNYIKKGDIKSLLEIWNYIMTRN
jgi:hypothetical protein